MARAIGVTRLADVTGLDRIGIPVFQAIRPLARSLSVSQGKGATRIAARVSALMEAIELHHAETVPEPPSEPPTATEVAFCARILPARNQQRPFDPAAGRAWLPATDLLTGAPLRVPHALVSMDFTRAPDDLWPSSNGLAAGNSHEEAIGTALCELLERDAQARWLSLGPAARIATQLNPDTIDDPIARRLFARIAAAGLEIRLWDLSEPHRLATLACAILDPALGPSLPPTFGAGCHPLAAVALARAICEAAQARATLIAGARDDIRPADYTDPAAANADLLLATVAFAPAGQRRWIQIPDHPAATLDLLLARIAQAGVPAVACLDLTRPEHGIPVVKLVAPGLADHDRPPP